MLGARTPLQPRQLVRSSPQVSDEALFLRFGNFANAYSVAFDGDLERFHSDTVDGVVAYARCKALRVTCGFFDPLCATENLPTLIHEFVRTARAFSHNERIVWWKVSAATAEALTRQFGFDVAPYGLENDVRLPRRSLGGTALRGLRRQVAAARRNGIYVEPACASRSSYEELASVTAAWRATRPQKIEARRVTRRTPHYDEPHCTKVVARRSRDGVVVGWAALDHIYSDEQLVGCGLNAVRYDPGASDGIASLLALDGAALVFEQQRQQQVLPPHREGQEHALPNFRLALGESPLVAFPPTRGIFFGENERRSRFVETLFKLVREHGRWLYGVRGIADWKRKWRADDQPTTFVAVDTQRPLRASIAAVALLLF